MCVDQSYSFTALGKGHNIVVDLIVIMNLSLLIVVSVMYIYGMQI